MTTVQIVCPVCRSESIETVADLPSLMLFKCHKCGTAFMVSRPVTKVDS
jgi:transposase-like protein